MEMSLGGFYAGKRVLITGHTGFKGAWLAQILIRMGAVVSGYSLAPNSQPNLYTALGLDKRITGSHIADIRDYKALSDAFAMEKPEIVFHLAAQPLVRDSYDDPLYTFSTNVMGTAHVLECIRHAPGVKAAVIITTDKVYENKGILPHKEGDELGGYDPYSSSKVCAEYVTKSYMRSFFNPDNPAGNRNAGPGAQNTKPGTQNTLPASGVGMPAAITASAASPLVASARAGNVIGGGDWSKDRLVPDIIRSLLEKNEPVALRNPASIRPWQHVLDPLFGYLVLGKRLYEGERRFMSAWNFAPEKESFITAQKLVDKSIRLIGKGSYEIKPMVGKHETAVLKLDASKAKKELGWLPHLGIDESLEWTLEWYKSYYKGDDVSNITNAQIGRYMESFYG
jgi:CDP-glucose 4,6-dehydratase